MMQKIFYGIHFHPTLYSARFIKKNNFPEFTTNKIVSTTNIDFSMENMYLNFTLSTKYLKCINVNGLYRKLKF